MNTQFIKIGKRIFAINHISAIGPISGVPFGVRLWVDGNDEAWDFQEDEGKAILQWMATLPCTDILARYEASKATE